MIGERLVSTVLGEGTYERNTVDVAAGLAALRPKSHAGAEAVYLTKVTKGRVVQLR